LLPSEAERVRAALANFHERHDEVAHRWIVERPTKSRDVDLGEFPTKPRM
jgi:hypothetical protein